MMTSEEIVFPDRHDAGRRLADVLAREVSGDGVIVLGLPRGGVPVAYEIARRLGAPLDVLVVRKLGVPGHEELAMGAIAPGGIRVVDEDIVRAVGVSRVALEHVAAAELAELSRREGTFRGDRPPLDVRGKTVIVVDDGLATGSTMAAAVEALRAQGPARLIVAVPVGPPEVCATLSSRADRVICLSTPDRMYAVGAWYEDFTQTTDAEVRALLDEAARDVRTDSARAEHAGSAPTS